MNDIKEIIKHWKRVFRNPSYVILSIVIAISFYALNVIIAQWKTIGSFYSTFGFLGTMTFFFKLMIGFGRTIANHSYISLILVSFLLGLFFSLIVYKERIIKGVDNKKIGFIASVGVFLSALVPGCAACGLGLASVLGLSSALITFLPYDGLELSILAVVILTYAIFKISNVSCKVMLNQKMKGGL